MLWIDPFFLVDWECESATCIVAPLLSPARVTTLTVLSSSESFVIVVGFAVVTLLTKFVASSFIVLFCTEEFDTLAITGSSGTSMLFSLGLDVAMANIIFLSRGSEIGVGGGCGGA
jgi:hypothetical protein